MILFKKPPTNIVVHHSATKPSMDWGVAEMKELHLSKGWADVGYHWVIKRDGEMQQGRNSKYQGAHCKAEGMNKVSIGVCLIGGVSEESTPTFEIPEFNHTFRQLNSLYTLVGLLGLPPSAHHDHDMYNKTFCPMFNVKEFFKINRD